MAEDPVQTAKILYVMLRKTNDQAKLRELLPQHLEWMCGKEKEGRVILSGTTDPNPAAALDGLTVIEANAREAADALAKEDPLIRSGAVTYSLHVWHVNEGRIELKVNLSDQSASLG